MKSDKLLSIPHESLSIDTNLLLSVLNQVDVCVFIKDTQGVYQFANSTTLKLLQREQPITGLTDQDIFSSSQLY